MPLEQQGKNLGKRNRRAWTVRSWTNGHWTSRLFQIIKLRPHILDGQQYGRVKWQPCGTNNSWLDKQHSLNDGLSWTDSCEQVDS